MEDELVYEGKRILCVIPARAGSRQLVGKNMRLLAGKPLIQYAFENAQGCPEIDRTIVSTDSDDVASLARELGLHVPFRRPAALAEGHVGTIDVLLHAMDYIEQRERDHYDVLVLLHATAPLCAVEDVTACIQTLISSGAGSVFTVAPAQRNPYFNMVEISEDGTVRLCKQGDFATRQDAPKVYELNSAVYAWRWDSLRDHKSVVLPDSRVHVMPRERSIDIDDELDLQLAELIIARDAQ
jgi:CMP-N-acetylneuraminic acid synthetase